MAVLEGSSVGGSRTVSGENIPPKTGDDSGSTELEGDNEEGILRIGEVTKVAGLTARTLRYWEEIGLISPIDHVENRERRYSVAVLERIDVIRRLQEVLGLSLSEVKAVLEQEDRLVELISRYRKDLDSGSRLVMLTEAKRANEEIVRRLDERLSEIGRFRMERVERGQRIEALIDQMLRDIAD
ncbi:MAG: MerR family transcriptional regulator [Acidimicrobiaceae bacterium]|nr:MerR family transcriptional regulator [Acidimicrobiaceae bacterium]